MAESRPKPVKLSTATPAAAAARLGRVKPKGFTKQFDSSI